MMMAALVLLVLLRVVFKDSIPKPKKTKAAKQVAFSTAKSSPLVKTEAAMAYSSASAAKYLMGMPSDVSLARQEGGAWPCVVVVAVVISPLSLDAVCMADRRLFGLFMRHRDS